MVWLVVLATPAKALAQPEGVVLSVTIVGPGTGLVTSSPAGIACRSACSAVFPFGSTVTLTAAGDAGFKLGSWSGDCSGAGICTVTMDGPRLALAAYKPAGNPYTVRRYFLPGPADGASPRNVTPVSDGTYLYGVTPEGGRLNGGVLFRARLDGSEYTLLHEFQFTSTFPFGEGPEGSLALAGSVLYGITRYGGEQYQGTVYRINTDGTGYAVLHTFSDRGLPGSTGLAPVTVDAGVIYGTTADQRPYGGGTIYKVNTDGSGYTVLHVFAGGVGDRTGTNGPLSVYAGALYGMTWDGGASGQGIIFKMSLDGSAFTVLHSFSLEEGHGPAGALTVHGGVLYGTTMEGGGSGHGTIFKVRPDGTELTVLHSFAARLDNGEIPCSGLVVAGAALYGSTLPGGGDHHGTIYKINTDGSGFSLVLDFGTDPSFTWSYPAGSLAIAGDALYGMTTPDAGEGSGTIYKVSLDGSSATVLHRFTSTPAEGVQPQGALTLADGELYGMTSYGGAYNSGTIFKIRPDGSGYGVLHSFSANSGSFPIDELAIPRGSLTLAGGVLFGTTIANGDYGWGTIFRIYPDGTNFAVLHEFGNEADEGLAPWGSLAYDGIALYGMATHGGTHDGGTIFRINPDGTGFTVLHSFAGYPNDGNSPYGDLTIHDGALYGMTYRGGASDYGHGAIFRVNVDGSSFTVLHSFDGYPGNGVSPIGSLTMADGVLYGGTSGGGAFNHGTIFRVNPDGTDFAVLHDFKDEQVDGSAPSGALSMDRGELFGVASNTLFKIHPDGSGFEVLPWFRADTWDWLHPAGSLTPVNGTLYGLTSDVGVGHSGTIFSYRHRDTFNITGTVAAGGSGLPGVAMAGLPGDPVSTSDGSYSAVVPLNWSGTVSPTLAGTTFSPASRSYSEVEADQVGQNYDATRAPTITSASSTTFCVGVAGTFIVTTTGSPAPAITIQGTLPRGVTWADHSNGTATLSGTPVSGAAGFYPLTVTANNGMDPSVTQSFTLSIASRVRRSLRR
jgi:uncharacterized repeat protein (TIGR03803 family)